MSPLNDRRSREANVNGTGASAAPEPPVKSPLALILQTEEKKSPLSSTLPLRRCVSVRNHPTAHHSVVRPS